MAPSPFGIIRMRKAVNLFSNCNESFNERFSPSELMRLYEAYAACGYDIPPDHWTENQVQDALLGVAPVFVD